MYVHITYLSSKRVQFYLSIKPAGSMTVLVLVPAFSCPVESFPLLEPAQPNNFRMDPRVCVYIEVAKTRGSKCRSIKGTNVYLRLNNNNLGTNPPVPLRSVITIRRKRKILTGRRKRAGKWRGKEKKIKRGIKRDK